MKKHRPNCDAIPEAAEAAYSHCNCPETNMLAEMKAERKLHLSVCSGGGCTTARALNVAITLAEALTQDMHCDCVGEEHHADNGNCALADGQKALAAAQAKWEGK